MIVEKIIDPKEGLAWLMLPNDNVYSLASANENNPAWGCGEGLFALEDGEWSPVSLRAFTSIGGYPIAYALQGVCCCSECAGVAYSDNPSPPLMGFINWETPNLHCDECGARIESAYAEEVRQ
tara:strand:- start:344 stop:712 length:369 start_codon:yes stop_codon:yes gene_type:complete